jgi:hypothetical protein
LHSVAFITRCILVVVHSCAFRMILHAAQGLHLVLVRYKYIRMHSCAFIYIHMHLIIYHIRIHMNVLECMTIDGRCTDATTLSRAGGGLGAFSTAESGGTRSGADRKRLGASPRSARATPDPPLVEPIAASDRSSRGWVRDEAGAIRCTLRGRDGSRFAP